MPLSNDSFMLEWKFKKCAVFMYCRGADCRQTTTCGKFPMRSAAYNGHFDVVQFIYYDSGAHDDIRKVTHGHSLLRDALYNGLVDVAKWLILKAALVYRYVTIGNIDDMVMRRDFCKPRILVPLPDARVALLLWDQNAVNNNFQFFKTGTN